MTVARSTYRYKRLPRNRAKAAVGGEFVRAKKPRPTKERPMAGMLEGKSALITGGGGGIGRATALAFAREGAKVGVADLVAEAAEETVASINRAGGQAISLTGDITSAEVVRETVGKVVATYGRVDCAFNNAGIAPKHVEARGMKTTEWSEEAFDRMIAVNLKSVWLCMKYEMLQMQTQGGGGAIVNTSSILGLVALPNNIAYTAAKHGVVGLTKGAALEYADDRIRVNAVCPGFIRTPMTADIPRERVEHITSRIALGRYGEPDEIAEMVVWLCSDRTSYVTGSAYAVDGGWTAI